ncbi:MAG: MBL fold metallo-hydrolase [Clostridia bacterium]|nr:MBL fold metallo-hydrolase [Clostridia bacterium]
MEIKTLVLGALQSNCYLISTTKAAVIIDPGFDSNITLDFLKQNKDKQRLILLTHGHFDHIGGAKALREATNTKIAISKEDSQFLLDPNLNLSAQFGEALPPFEADILIDLEDEISVGDLTFKIIKTPGHTTGGLCFLIGEYLFSGDTLFCRSIGRTDFPNGNFSQLKASIEKLYTLDEDTIVLSGHGPETTIAEEKLYNPFVRG